MSRGEGHNGHPLCLEAEWISVSDGSTALLAPLWADLGHRDETVEGNQAARFQGEYA